MTMRGWRGLGLQTLAFVGAAFFMTTSPIVTKLSQVDGRFCYSIISATLLAEVLKGISSALGLLVLASQQRATHGGSVLRALDALCPRSARQFLLYGVPSAVYMLNNNLVFVILTFISATTFQIFACMKTIMCARAARASPARARWRVPVDARLRPVASPASSAACSRRTGVVMHVSGMKRLSRAQMGAISLLACSIFIVTSTASRPSGAADARASGSASKPPQRAMSEHAMLFGLLLTVLTTTFSTAGGVFNEKLLKDNRHHSIHWQNLQLYAWGVLFNTIALVVSGTASSALLGGGGGGGGGLLHGYTTLTWVVVLNNASIGLCISAVLKFLDNIARVYAHGFAMIATLVIEVALSAHSVEPKLIAAIWVISASSYVYNLDAAKLPTESVAVQTGSGDADAWDESDSSGGELADGEPGTRPGQPALESALLAAKQIPRGPSAATELL
jgi:hypothetical protein